MRLDLEAAVTVTVDRDTIRVTRPPGSPLARQRPSPLWPRAVSGRRSAPARGLLSGAAGAVSRAESRTGQSNSVGRNLERAGQAHWHRLKRVASGGPGPARAGRPARAAALRPTDTHLPLGSSLTWAGSGPARGSHSAGPSQSSSHWQLMCHGD